MTFGFKVHGQEVEEIIVTGKAIKESQMAAIEAKRQAVNVADIISADAIGRFPDVNLSDSLGRLPGISIERDQGQARYVSFRGTPKRYTTTAFNGIIYQVLKMEEFQDLILIQLLLHLRLLPIKLLQLICQENQFQDLLI